MLNDDKLKSMQFSWCSINENIPKIPYNIQINIFFSSDFIRSFIAIHVERYKSLQNQNITFKNFQMSIKNSVKEHYDNCELKNSSLK